MPNKLSPLVGVVDDTGTVIGLVHEGVPNSPMTSIGATTAESIATALETAVTEDPASLVQIQGLVSGGLVEPAISPVEFIRKLSFRRLLWVGDSTVDQASGNGVIPANWAYNDNFAAIPGYTENKNYGKSTATTTDFINAAPGWINNSGNDCALGSIAAECVSANVTGIVLSLLINDFRNETLISTIGSGDWVAAVTAAQQRLKTIVTTIRNTSTAIANIPVIFLVPNTLAATSTYISGPSGQAVTDAIRAAYLGHGQYGIAPISQVVPLSDVCDAGGACWGVKSWPLADLPNTMTANDGVHPSTIGYQHRTKYFAYWVAELCAVGEWETLCSGLVSASASSYMDLGFSIGVRRLFGNTSGTAYGALTPPGIGIGDTLRFVLQSGLERVMRLTAKPYNNNGESLIRWVNPPDGAWHASDIPAGSRFTLIRRRVACAPILYAKNGDYTEYPVRVISGGVNTMVVRALPWAASLATRAPTTGDWLCLPSNGGAVNSPETPGLSMSAATITATGQPGEYTIAMTGAFATAAQQIGAILVRN